MNKIKKNIVLFFMFTLIPCVAQANNVFNGAKIYEQQCIHCHGSDGNGWKTGAPDFSTGEKMEKSDSELFDSVYNGVSIMPAYQGRLKDQEIRDTITYIRSFQYEN